MIVSLETLLLKYLQWNLVYLFLLVRLILCIFLFELLLLFIFLFHWFDFILITTLILLFSQTLLILLKLINLLLGHSTGPNLNIKSLLNLNALKRGLPFGYIVKPLSEQFLDAAKVSLVVKLCLLVGRRYQLRKVNHKDSSLCVDHQVEFIEVSMDNSIFGKVLQEIN